MYIIQKWDHQPRSQVSAAAPPAHYLTCTGIPGKLIWPTQVPDKLISFLLFESI